MGKTEEHDVFIQLALRDFTGEQRVFDIKRRPTGKPYAVDGPCFSFADSCGYVLCAVSRGEIGADLELSRSATKYMPVAKRFFASDEAAAATEENFFELFTAKEAYVKYTEMGIFSGMEFFSAMSGQIGDVNIIKFIDGNCICAAASKTEREVNVKWIYL